MHPSIRALLLSVACSAPALSAAAPLAADHPLVSDMLYVDLARAGERLVAVGDRGTIVWSDDQGEHWTQAETPTGVLLNAVCFADARRGWAVGHDAVILATEDGGRSWQERYADALGDEDEPAFDEDAADTEEYGDPYAWDDAGDDEAWDDGDGMAADTSGAPFLDILCGDGDHLIAVGGYGYTVESTDGGETWTRRTADMANPDGWHLYAIQRLGDSSTLLVAGEKGTLLRSRDNGVTWQRLASPYDGTFFGITGGERVLLVHGMQGQVWATRDGGDSWRQVRTGVTRGINAGTVLDDGTIVLAGASGALLVSHDNGNSLALQYLPDRATISAVLPLADGSLLIAGVQGLRKIRGPGRP